MLAALFAVGATGQAPSVHSVEELQISDHAIIEASKGVALQDLMVFFARPRGNPGPNDRWSLGVTDGSVHRSIKDVPTSNPGPAPLAARVHDCVIFGIDHADGTSDVWRTDGTAAGTRRILQGYGVSSVPDRWHGGAWIVFGAKRGTRSYLYRTDGTTVAYVGTMRPSHLTAVAWQSGAATRYLTFYASPGTASDPQAIQPHVVESLPSGTTSPRVVRDPVNGPALWFDAPPESTGFATWVEPVSKDLYLATVATSGGMGSEMRRFRCPFAGSSFTFLPTGEVAPGAASALPRDLVVRGDEVLFSAENVALGRELWRLSFANGQLTPTDLQAGFQGSTPRGLFAVPALGGGPLPDIWFSAFAAGVGRELWRHDGTAASLVVDANLFGDSDPEVLGHADGRVFFAATDVFFHGRELWRSDGTTAGTAMVYNVAAHHSSDPRACGVLAVGGNEFLLYSAATSFTGSDRLLRANAATAAPTPVPWLSLYWARGTDLRPMREAVGGGTARWADGRALILGTEVTTFFNIDKRDTVLWLADGRAGQVTLLAPPGTLVGQDEEDPTAICFDDGTALILANSNHYGRPRLFVTDGTAVGTRHVATVPVPGTASQWPKAFGLMEFGDGVYFGTPETPTAIGTAAKIWQTTRAGAAPQAVVGAAQGIRNMQDWTVVGDRIFLTGERVDGSTGRELWVWQPPAAPTLVADIRPGAAGSSPASLVAFRNRCFFTADDGVHGRELWASNGLASGTFLVRDANPGLGNGAAGPLVDVGTLVYAGNDGVHGSEPWRSSGVQAGTAMIADLYPGPLGSSIGSITPVHVGVVACTAHDGVHGLELWRIDTTTGATLFDLRPGAFSSNPNGLVWSTRHLFFWADDGVHGREPWYASWIDFQSVAMVADLAPGGSSSMAITAKPIPAGRHVMFPAWANSGSNELWAVDMSGASSPIGDSCVRPFQTLRLRSTAPRLGQGLTYWVFEPGVGAPATTLMSLVPAAPGPVNLPNVSCPVWVDPASAVVVDSFVTTGNFVRTVTVPAALALLGTVARMQVLLDYPPNLATNGLELVVGN
ncbi:MAG: hypothetical protein IPK26_20705 [Planctomycetes bacterium]|nr:hypothetical protein [Planctomycetota bacterium]